MLRRSLALKLTLAFLLVGLTVALLVAVFIRLTSADQLNRLVVEQQRAELHNLLTNYYQTYGSWDGVAAYVQRNHGEGPETYPGDGDDNHPGGRNQHQPFALADAKGLIVMGAEPEYATGTQLSSATLAQGEAVEVNGQVVGTILTPMRRAGLNPEETAYLDRVNQALIYASLGAVLVALIVGLLLARTLTRPLQALTAASHRMAGGALEQEVPVTSGDELGELATAFNRMSHELAQANKARRQMTADIAHELRTPLTVIAGYIESMRDGVLKATPERFGVIYDELEHLQHLVGDLRVLSQADAGELQLNRQPLTAGELLQQAQATFAHQAEQQGVSLQLDVEQDLPELYGDDLRLAQVLANLLANALRYTPAGGHITLAGRQEGDSLVLQVADTGTGIGPDDLPNVFNRFYRADKSRSEENGESGLGLAIVKALVEAHGGVITVESSLGQGTTFSIRLPVPAAR